MKPILTLHLENDMDLILAHKRVMKLSELSGLSLPLQTIFATAVSEVARVAIEKCERAQLTMRIMVVRGNKKQLQAVVSDEKAFCTLNSESITYARRLADDVRIEVENGQTQVILSHHLPMPGLLTETKIQSFIDYFKQERALSPYEELRRKNAQLEELACRLRESESSYSQMTNSLPLMMFSVQKSGKVIYTNQWLRDFLGVNVVDLHASQCQPYLHAEDYEKMQVSWKNSNENFNVLHGQIRLKQAASQQFIWHLISIMPIRSNQGQIEQWNGFLVDIHAQKLIEQTLKDNSELKAAQEKLEYYQRDLEHKIIALHRSNRDLEQFASIASHDLQEPLRKIRTFVSLIRQDMDDKQALEKYFGKINHAAERMSQLIEGVLEYSLISNEEPLSGKTDLNKIIQQVERDFELLIRQKGAIISTGRLPEIQGQALQLHQLFSNLFSNALKFSTAQPVINISARPLSPEEVAMHPTLKPEYDYTSITFADNGIGFEQQYSEKIFTLFQQLNGRDTYGGTGIGLALCKKVVERHHGLIHASSQPGKGTTFEIYLPGVQEESWV